MSADVKPFRIAVGDDVLDDLKSRLRRTRWPEAEPVDDWSQGVPLDWLQDICRYWADDYDWRAREALLNRFAQFTTAIDGLDIHFIHVRSPHPEALPLVITHGWPGSIVEFHKVIEPLDDPDRARRRCRRRLPRGLPVAARLRLLGQADDHRLGRRRIADAWAELMARLGYDRYVAQGGDWGSAVTTSIGAQDAEHCAGIHITLAMGDAAQASTASRRPRRQRALDGVKYYRDWDSGYSKQQATRPQTLGYGLDRFAGRPGGVDPREVLGVDRLRRPSRERARPATSCSTT